MTEPSSPRPDTRDLLLDAAEKLFSEHGIAAASLRAITAEAGANLAAVHYHFGSKTGLVRAVFARRIGPLNRERLERLAACEAAAGAPELACVVRAFVEPVLRMLNDDRHGGHDFARLVGRGFSDPVAEVRDVLIEEFRPVIERFLAALERALPHLARTEVCWRFHFMVGSMGFAAGHGAMAHRLSGGLCDPHDTDLLIDHLTGFLVGGLGGPAAGAAARRAADPGESR